MTETNGSGQRRAGITRAIEAEAEHVVEQWRSTDVRFKPYNRPKVGVLGAHFFDPATGDERQGLRLSLYRTDYFTHRVMHRLLEQVRGEADALPYDVDGYPDIDGRPVPHVLTSVGLNVNLISTAETPPVLLLARLGSTNANVSAHGRLHVAMNEGLNLADFAGPGAGADRLSLAAVMRRAMQEECELDEAQISSVEVAELFVTRDNLETGLHVIVRTREAPSSIIERRRASRDIRREFGGSLEAVRIGADGIDALLGREVGGGLSGMVYYLPVLLNTVAINP